MAKRFTDTERWNDEWFQDLSPMMKLLGAFLWDRCDHAGIWRQNKKLTEFALGGPIDWAGVPQAYGSKIAILGDYWFIPRFLTIQYGDDLGKGKAVLSAVSRIEALGFSSVACQVLGDPYIRVKEGLGKSSVTTQATAKATAQAQAKAVVKTQKGSPEGAVQHLEFVYLTSTEFTRLGQMLRGANPETYIARLNGYIGQIGPKKAAAKYKSHYHTILNWYRKDVEEGKVRIPPPAPKPKAAAPLPPELTASEQDEIHYEFVDAIDHGHCRIINCQQCARRKKTEGSHV